MQSFEDAAAAAAASAAAQSFEVAAAAVATAAVATADTTASVKQFKTLLLIPMLLVKRLMRRLAM